MSESMNSRWLASLWLRNWSVRILRAAGKTLENWVLMNFAGRPRLAHSNARPTALFMNVRLTMALAVGVATQIEKGLVKP